MTQTYLDGQRNREHRLCEELDRIAFLPQYKHMQHEQLMEVPEYREAYETWLGCFNYVTALAD